MCVVILKFHFLTVQISPEDKAAPLDNASKIFQSPLDDSEQGDFVDYGWAFLILSSIEKLNPPVVPRIIFLLAK